MRALLLIFIILIGKMGYGQTVENNTRAAFPLKLFVNDTTFFEAEMYESKYIPKEGVVQIFPGEKLFVEADLLKDSLVSFKLVPQIINKSKTLIISFNQSHENNIHKQMILSVVNPFSKKLQYEAIINLMKQKRWVKTSIIPVLPGLVSYETWSDIITTIALSDFHLIP